MIGCSKELDFLIHTVPLPTQVYYMFEQFFSRLAATPGSTSSSSATSDSVRSPAPIIRVLSPDLVEMSLSPSFQSLHPALSGLHLTTSASILLTMTLPSAYHYRRSPIINGPRAQILLILEAPIMYHCK